MFRRPLLVLLLLTLCGCSSNPRALKPAYHPELPVPDAPPAVSVKPVKPVESAPPVPAEEEPAAPVLSMVFAKTAFEGVTKTSYIEFTLTNQAEPGKLYQLIIGEKANQVAFPWKIKTVQPGYFFLELPVGEYMIRSVAIPVGTTQAVEPINITFSVTPDQANYLGTLMLIGTKEKIKLGGIPVIQPGFEYQAVIIDQSEEARQEFMKNYPELTQPVKVQLMRINPLQQADAPTSP